MSGRLGKFFLLLLTTVILTMVTTSCTQMGHIVNSEEINKLYGIENNEDKNEIIISKSGAIIYKDKSNKSDDFGSYSAPGFNTHSGFGPHDITFGPENDKNN
ncbi:MAG: hypothetical protein WCK67_02835 [bacterium]